MSLQIKLDFTKAYSPGPDVAVLESLPAKTDPEILKAPIIPAGELYLDRGFLRVKIWCPFCGNLHIHGREVSENFISLRWSHCARSEGFKAMPYRIKFDHSFEIDYVLLKNRLGKKSNLKQIVNNFNERKLVCHQKLKR